jgi:Immunoglobulin domain
VKITLAMPQTKRKPLSTVPILQSIVNVLSIFLFHFFNSNGFCNYNNQIPSVLPQIVPFTFGKDEIYFDESVTATCSVSFGDLPIKFWWTLSDSFESLSEYNISTNDGIVISKAGNKLSFLNIEAVKARHRGNYTCYAQNKAGTAKQSAYLAVNGYPYF